MEAWRRLFSPKFKVAIHVAAMWPLHRTQHCCTVFVPLGELICGYFFFSKHLGDESSPRFLLYVATRLIRGATAGTKAKAGQDYVEKQGAAWL